MFSCMGRVALDVSTSPWWWLKLQMMICDLSRKLIEACMKRKLVGSAEKGG